MEKFSSKSQNEENYYYSISLKFPKLNFFYYAFALLQRTYFVEERTGLSISKGLIYSLYKI